MSEKFWDVYWKGAQMERLRRTITVNRITEGDLQRAALGTASMSFGLAAAASKHIAEMRAQWTGGMENVYRVRFSPNERSVEVACLGIESVDKEVEGIYLAMSELPDWMQGKLAVLHLMKVDPPQTKVDGVGMRVDEHVFWVIKGD